MGRVPVPPLLAACPGLQELRPDIQYARSVGEGNEAPAEWGGEFELTWIDCEVNPFTGKPFFNEVWNPEGYSPSHVRARWSLTGAPTAWPDCRTSAQDAGACSVCWRLLGLTKSAQHAGACSVPWRLLGLMESPFISVWLQVLFCHAPSESLFVTDFFWNYPEAGLPLGSALWKLGMDRVYLPFYTTFMVRDKAALGEQVSRVLAQPWHVLVPCHGPVVRNHAKQRLLKHIST